MGTSQVFEAINMKLPSQHKNVGPTKAIGRHQRRFGVGADVGCSSD